MDTKQMIGVRISKIRSEKGMTQECLAGKMGISSKYLSSIERGKENPTLKTLITMSEALNVDLGELFRFVQIEDASKRKAIVTSLVNKADAEELRLAFNILSALLKK